YLSILGANRVTILDLPPLSGVKPCSGHSQSKVLVCLFSLSVITVGASSSSDNTVLINNLDAGNPLHIQTNDNSNIALIPFKLLGTENYRIWASAMKLALQARNKFSFINATVDSKAVVVTEASIRSSLLFNDADESSLFSSMEASDTYHFALNLDNTRKKFLMYPRFLMVFLNNQIELGEPFNDVYPTPAHNLKVFTNMSRKGLKFSGKVTPLFDCMLVPHQAPKGEGSDQPTEPQPTPSPTQTSTGDQPPETSPSHATTQDSRDSLEGTDGNEGDQVQTPHDSPLLGGHTSDRAEGALNLQELSVLCTNLSNRVLALESIKDAQAAEISVLKSRIKKLEKKCNPSISHHKAWLKSVKRLSIKERFRQKESISKQGRKKSKPESTLDDSTVFDDQDADHSMEYMETKEAMDEGRQSGDKRGNAKELVSTARPELSTARPNVDAARQEDSVVNPRTPLITTNVEDSSRPARSTLTLKPLPTIDPKDKGKSVLEEPEPAKKMTRKVERERQGEEEASKAAIAEMYDEVQAKIDADALFAAKLQQEERAKFLAETIAAQRKFRAAQRSAKIRSMYERQKKSVQDFMPIGSERDKKMIEKMNKKAAGMDEEEVPEEPVSTKVEVEQEASDEDKEVIYEMLDKKYPIIEWKSEYHGIKPQFDETKDLEEININVVIRSNGQRRYFSTLMRVLSIFDREDLCAVYQLVMNRYQDETPEGFDRILWGDLMIMFNPTDEDEFWNSQQDWNVVSWKLHCSSGVHTLMTDAGLVIHMLVEKKYPLRKKVLLQMLELKLESEEDSTMALELIRFVKKLIAELEPENSDGDGKDL
ncbi:retrovirus-related pol polyprotein from transposon TNT 1-94, partial [Tanacetum coccineum]